MFHLTSQASTEEFKWHPFAGWYFHKVPALCNKITPYMNYALLPTSVYPVGSQYNDHFGLLYEMFGTATEINAILMGRVGSRFNCQFLIQKLNIILEALVTWHK